MRRYSTRLRFSEDDLKQRTVRKAAEKADRAADRADKAKAKLKASRKLTRETAANAARKGKLVQAGEIKNPANSVRAPLETARSAVSRMVHRQVSEHQEDNVGVQSANASTEAAETAVEAVSHHAYSQKLRKYDKAAKLERAADKANVSAIYEARRAENAQSRSNPISRWRQKRNIQKEYAAAKRAGHRVYDTGKTAEYAKEAAKKTKSVVSRIGSYAAEHSHVLLIVLLIGGVAATISGAFSSCGAMGSGGTHAILASSFTAADEDILGANEDYLALEQELQARINNIEADYPDYDEYVYNLAEINHNPYELISYLTVRFEDFHRDQVQDALQQVFSAQYELSTVESVEMRTRTVTETDPETGEETTREEEYEYHILTVTLRNHGVAATLNYAGFTESQIQRYRLLIETKGNKPYLFEDDIYANEDYLDYDIPGEALTDERFANMIHEAEKYLGYPYVWGGSSPSTSFDCSGFVCWVINHCGNGWNYGRLDAETLRRQLSIIPASAAKPGDIIFFQGTYDTYGASHVGIYVGGGMMIHCGNPISYANINTSYWQAHFYCYGRLP